MRKTALCLLFCFLFLPLLLCAQDDWDEPWIDPFGDEPAVQAPFGIKDRIVEAGINLNVNFANNYISFREFFRETVVIDIDKLEDGFKLNFGFAATPLCLNFNSRKGWGFGFFTGIDAAGVLGLSGDMLSFKKTNNSKSDLSGAVFAEAGISSFFTIKKFKIKISPAFYYTVLYLKSDVSYTYSDDELLFNLDMQFFTAFPADGDLSDVNITASPGIDINAGLEYPISKETGLDSRIPVLNFDLGIDFYNIPIVPSRMKNYMRLNAKLGGLIDELGESAAEGDLEPVYGEGDEQVFRPFKTVLWAAWRPFAGNRLFTVIPSLGFSINPLYNEPASFDFGIKARLNLANLFICTAGIGYDDRIWVNSLDMALNFRAFELDIGINLRSQDFEKSWTGTGLGVYAGVKFGW